MEKQFFITLSGQSVQTQDLDLMGKTAALADDRVLAELLRMAPKSGDHVAKAVLPSGYPGGGPSFGPSIVKPAIGHIEVAPFRAIVGSREAGTPDAVKGWRDIRSAVFASNEGKGPSDPAMLQRIGIQANTSAHPRWDLVYARVDVDIEAEGAVRLHKDPATMAVMPKNIAPYKFTKVTVVVRKGDEEPSPKFPDIEADAGNAYYIPLAYVRVQAGFSGSTQLHRADIWEVAPVVTLAEAVGGNALKPANHHYKIGGNLVGDWPAVGGEGDRPATFMPPTMVGGESRILLIEGNADIQPGTVLDDSVDWRNRFFRTTYQVISKVAAVTRPGAISGTTVPDGFYEDSKTSLGESIFKGEPENTVATISTELSSFHLMVDRSTGSLIWGVPNALPAGETLFIWLEASAQYEW